MHRRTFMSLLAALIPTTSVLAHGSNKFDMVDFTPPVPAPEFSIKDIGGETRGVGGDQAGKFVLLNFWATWCPPCVAEMPSLQMLQNNMNPDKFMVLAVSSDRPDHGERVKEFADRLELNFPIAHDRDGTISSSYGAVEFPSTYLIDPSGNILSAAKGERVWGSIRAIQYFLDVMRHHA